MEKCVDCFHRSNKAARYNNPVRPIGGIIMATMPVESPPHAPKQETTEQRFRRLQAAWMADVEFLSDAGKIIGHPAFQEIIALGDVVVPLMLRDLESGPSLWVWALLEITGEDPVPASDRGSIRKMSDAWLKSRLEKGMR